MTRKRIITSIVGATIVLWSVFAIAWATRESPLLLDALPVGQVIGTLLMFALLPPLQWLIAIPMYLTVAEARDALAPLANRADTERVGRRLNGISLWGIPFVLISLVFGAYQNERLIAEILSGAEFGFIDVVFVGGNVLLWGTVGLLLVWRLPLGFALSQFARRLNLDILSTRRPDTDGPRRNH